MKKQIVMSIYEYSDLTSCLDSISYYIEKLEDGYWKNELLRYIEHALDICGDEEE